MSMNLRASCHFLILTSPFQWPNSPSVNLFLVLLSRLYHSWSSNFIYHLTWQNPPSLVWLQAEEQTGKEAACQTANTHTNRDACLTLMPDVSVHDTQELMSTSVTLFLPLSLFLPAAIMKVAAFNIQKFGRSKVASPDVLEILVKVTHINGFLGLLISKMFLWLPLLCSGSPWNKAKAARLLKFTWCSDTKPVIVRNRWDQQ